MQSGYLIKEQSICDATIKVFSDYIGFYDTPFTVTIPPTVGPAGAHYTLIGRIINTDGSYYGATWESDVIDLTGANGTWADYQKNGYQLWGDDGMACTGFACVKDCADTYGVEAPFSSSENATNGTYNDCANACPDVNIAFGISTQGGQPTASLTQPTACPSLPGASSTETATVTNGDETTTTGLLRSSTRTAAAAAGTGAAVPNLPSHAWLPAFVMLLTANLAVG